jgi:4-diphosphocytidyl-2-C-methyl-D-erythritol kinase
MELPAGTGRVKMSETARAKINLFLHVGERRPDGFHPLQSLAVFTEFGDALEAEAAGDLSLSLAGPFAAQLGDADNLVLKAARLLAERAGRPAQAKLILTKNLPVASGIGGGSADAAAALRALIELWQLNLEEGVMGEIAAALGSDVPVCLKSAHAFMEGRGEILNPLTTLPRLPLLLVNPGVAVSTRDIFAGLSDRRGTGLNLPKGGFDDVADLLRFLESTGNDLEAPARALQPVIGQVLAALGVVPGCLFARMSGSGATCFALLPDDDASIRAAEVLRRQHPGWWIQPSFVPALGIVHAGAGRDIGPTPEGL